MKNSDDLKTLVEYVNQKDNTLKEELLREVSSLTEQVLNEVKNNPEFRGPMGYEGKDGERGPEGKRGPAGPMPMFEYDDRIGRIRFQTGNLINEETGDAQPAWSDWMNIKGEDGPVGDTGPQGAPGEQGPPGLIGEQGPMGPVGPQGLIGEVGPQGEMGPQGEKGDKGDPGDFPKWQADTDNHRIRFQVSEDVLNPWGEWLNLPQGEQGIQGEKGEKGDPFVFEDFTQQQIMMITGPKGDKGDKGDKGEPGAPGPKGPMGERGPTGKAGPRGADGANFDAELFTKAEKKHAERVRKTLADAKKRLTDEANKLRLELERKTSTIGKPNELIVPVGPGGTDNHETTGSSNVAQIVNGVPIPRNFRSGTPVFLDNPVRASMRRDRNVTGDSDQFDPENFIVVADAGDLTTAGDGLAIVTGVARQLRIVRVGIVEIRDMSLIDTGDSSLRTGEYYYLANTQIARDDPAHNNVALITPNPPQFGIHQLVGQAIGPRHMYVNFNQDPIDLSRSPVQVQGSNGARIPRPTTAFGEVGDQAGDVNFDANHFYFCIENYNDAEGTRKIWKRVAWDSSF